MNTFPCVITRANPDHKRPYVSVQYLTFQTEDEMNKEIEKVIIYHYSYVIQTHPSIKSLSVLQSEIYSDMYMANDVLTAQFFSTENNRWEEVNIEASLLSVIDKLRSSQEYDEEDDLGLSDLIQPNELVGMDADVGEIHLMENGYRIVVRINPNTAMAICSTANFDQKRVTMYVNGNNVIQSLTIG